MVDFWRRFEDVGHFLLSGNERMIGSGYQVLKLTGSRTASACLVQVSSLTNSVCLCLAAPKTHVGRGRSCDYGEDERRRLQGVVEGSQWLFRWADNGVQVRDAKSTNGSVLIAREDRDESLLKHGRAMAFPRARRLGWDGKSVNDDPADVAVGDLLVNAYCAFIFWSAA